MSSTRRPAATLARGVRGVRGVEMYTRVSLYLFVLFELMFFLYAVVAVTDMDVPAPAPGPAFALVVLALFHMAMCFLTVHVGFDAPLVVRRRPHPAVVALLLSACALVAASIVVLPAYDGGGLFSDPRSLMISGCGAATCGALAVGLPIRRLAVGSLAVPAVAVGVRLVGVGGGSDVVGTAVVSYLFAIFWAGTVRMSMWIVEVVRELDEARGVAARLAVAEERLRIARDMHDVVGRALSAVAVKSELAAALARRGDPRGADEMDDVRSLAQDSLREVRGVVAGYRAADLANELEGARSVLRAAGVAVRVVGEVPDLPAPQVEALAWVVREAVTNIVRHSAASASRIDLAEESGDMVLRVSNDGVLARAGGIAGPGGGNGIVGLRERLAAVGGSVDVASDGDRFVLTARVPVRSDVIA